MLKNKTETQIIAFAGLNKRAAIEDNELSLATNLSTKNFPYLSPRNPRTASITLGGVGYGLFASSKLAYVDGTSFKYDSNTEGSVAASIKHMAELSGTIVIFPDKKYYNTTTDTFGDMLGSVDMELGGYSTDGVFDPDDTTRIYNQHLITVKSSTSYTLTNDKGYTNARAFYYDVNQTFISYTTVNFAAFTTPATAEYMNIDIVGTDTSAAVKITNAVYPTAGGIPTLAYVCELDNRLWGVDGDNIYCTALGEYDNWTTFSSPSEATDAWSVDTGTLGNFTGIASYKGYIIAVKNDRVYKLFGDIPENFQFIEISRLGCIDANSMCEVNNILFWLSPQGLIAYTGGVPEVVSEKLNETYTSGVGGGDGRYYYLSLNNGTTYPLYVYDTWRGIWTQEDENLQFKGFAYYDGYLHGLSGTNIIYKFGTGTETVTMTAVTKEYHEEAPYKKGHSEISVRVDLEAGSELSVYTRIDNGSFTLVKTYKTADFNSFVVPIKINRADHLQLKFVMVGEGKIYGFQRKFYYGGTV